jgi:two-component system, chemotaxis family, chemotaxis protein CheY
MDDNQPSKEDLKILVTDDSLLSRKVVCEVLTNYGYTNLTTASTAEEAYFKSKKDTYHLHIVDIVLAETSGLDLIKSLGEIPSPKNILVTSSLSSETYILEAISAGANDFLKKPFEENDLLKSVERLFHSAIKEKIL